MIPQLRHDESRVRAVLFVWGGGRTGADLPARPVRVAGVDVVYGVASAKVWRDALADVPANLSNEDIDDVWARIRKQAAETDKRDAADPLPPTLARLYWTAAATGLAAVVGLLAGIYALRLPGGGVTGFWVCSRRRGGRSRGAKVGGVAISGVGLADRRRLLRRPPGGVGAVRLARSAGLTWCHRLRTPISARQCC